MVTHLIISVDEYCRFDPKNGILEFDMEEGNSPVAGSLRRANRNLDLRMQQRVFEWASRHTDRSRFPNVEVKIVGGMVWFITDPHRQFNRREIFDTVYQGSELAVT